jgi:hypothetical protein
MREVGVSLGLERRDWYKGVRSRSTHRLASLLKVPISIPVYAELNSVPRMLQQCPYCPMREYVRSLRAERPQNRCTMFEQQTRANKCPESILPTPFFVLDSSIL